MAKKKNVSKKQKAVANKARARTEYALKWESGFWQKNWLPALIIFLVSVGLYIQTLPYEYVLDDKIVLSENSFVKQGFSGIDSIMKTESMTGYFGEQKDLIVGARYRPLSLVTFAIEHQFFGLNVKVHHLGNILLYALTCLLIFRLLALFFPMGKKLQMFWSVPFVAAMLYVVHPLHSEAVANIKGRDEIMTMLLSLMVLYVSMRYLYKQQIILLFGSACLFLLALLAKENAITFLAIVPLTAYVFTKAEWKQIGIITTPLLIIFGLYLALRIGVVGYLVGDNEVTALMNNPFVEATGGEKYATIMQTVGIYIKLLFYPHPLTHDYYPYHVPLVDWGDWKAFVPLLLTLGLTIFALMKIRSKNIVAYSILFFFITFSIVSNVVFPVGTFMNERFMFMPSMGFCLLVAYFLVKMLPKYISSPNAARYAGMALAGLLVIGYTAKSFSRIPAWENTRSLNYAASQVSVNSARANQFWGYYLYEEATKETDRTKKLELYKEAEVHINKAIQIHPTYIDALRAKSGIMAGYYQLNELSLEQLLDHFYTVTAVRRVDFVETYMEYLRKKRDVNKQALLDFYHKTGYELLAKQRGDLNLAYFYLQQAEKVDPNDFRNLGDMAMLLYSAKNFEKAITYGNKALGINPNSAEVNLLLGRAYEQTGNAGLAQQHLDKARSLNPNVKIN